jgi:hypothetical protein
MNRAEFIKKIGIFGTVLTGLGLNKALANQSTDDNTITNNTLFDIKYFTDSFGKVYNCELQVNYINKFYRSNKVLNKEKIIECGKLFDQHTYLLNKKFRNAIKGKYENNNDYNFIIQYFQSQILLSKCHLLLGNGKTSMDLFSQLNNDFAILRNGKKYNGLPKGLTLQIEPYASKEIAETWLKIDTFKQLAEPILESVIYEFPNSFSKTEIKRLKTIHNEIILNISSIGVGFTEYVKPWWVKKYK